MSATPITEKFFNDWQQNPGNEQCRSKMASIETELTAAIAERDVAREYSRELTNNFLASSGVLQAERDALAAQNLALREALEKCDPGPEYVDDGAHNGQVACELCWAEVRSIRSALSTPFILALMLLVASYGFILAIQMP